jgi:hypothetical protein
LGVRAGPPKSGVPGREGHGGQHHVFMTPAATAAHEMTADTP